MKNKQLLTYTFMAMLLGASTYAIANDVYYFRAPLPGVIAGGSADGGGEAGGDPAPACEPPTLGTQSSNFCGQEGFDVYYIGDVTGRQIFAELAEEGGGPFYWGTNVHTTGATDGDNGKTNTATIEPDIDADLGTYNPPSYTPNAIKTCTAKGEGWYLPAVNELKKLAASGIPGSAVSAYFWSSTEYNSNNASILNLSSGGEIIYGKNNTHRVWCVRS